MGNIILSNSFINVAAAAITARSTDSTFGAAVNVMDRWHLKRRFRANDVTTNAWLLKFDMTTVGQVVAGVLLSDINFDKAVIQGNATDSWSPPSFPGSISTVSQNPITGRYNIYIPLTGFAYRWLLVGVATGATAVGPYTTKWEVGTVSLLSAVTTLSHNMSYGYSESGEHFYREILLPHGGMERVKVGSNVAWKGGLVFGNRAKTDSTELKTVNQMDMSQPIMYYLNDSNTSEAMLCVRDTSLELTQFAYNAVSGNTITLRELV